MSRFIEIKSCKDCPHRVSERAWTKDSFETEFRWTCKLSDRIIAPFVAWNESKLVTIPEWCKL